MILLKKLLRFKKLFMKSILLIFTLLIFIIGEAFASPNSSTHSNVTDALSDPTNTYVLTRPNVSGTIATLSGGVLPVANGGTGLSAAGLLGNILTSNGTNWVSSPPSGSSVFNGSDLALAVSDTIAIDPTSRFQRWQVQGNSGPVALSSTPFSGGVLDGTEIVVFGNDNTNTVEFTNNDIAGGCILNGNAVLLRYFMITFIYNASLDRFIEKSRSF